MAEAVAQPQQIGIAALTDTAVGAIGPGAVVNAPHHRPLGCDQALHLEGQIVEEGGVVLAEGALVITGFRQQADPLLKEKAQPGQHPEAHPHPDGPLTKGLGRCAGEGHRLVELTPRLGRGVVAQQVAIDLQGEGACIHQPPLQIDTCQIFRPKMALEQKSVAEIGGEHLSRPGGDRPGIGMPLGRCWNGGRTGDRLRWRQGGQRHDGLGGIRGLGRCGPGGGRQSGRGHQGQVTGTGVQVKHPIDVVHLADALLQAEPQPAGLQILLTPLKTHTAKGIKGAGAGVELDPIGQQPAAADQGPHRAGANKTVQLVVEFLAIGTELDFQGWRRHRRGSRRPGPIQGRRLERRRRWRESGFRDGP